MAARGFSIEDTYNLLGISHEQYDEMIKWNKLRHRVADRENTKLMSMQQDVHQRLLNRGEFQTGSITQATYKHLFNHHLGSIVNSDKLNFTTCTKAHLSRAQAFLRARELTATLAGLWEEPVIGVSRQVIDVASLKDNTGGGALQSPAENRRGENRANISPSKRAAGERGRTAVRRSHIEQSEETLSSHAPLITTDHFPQTMPPNGAHAHAPAGHEPILQLRCVNSSPNADVDKDMQNVSSKSAQDASLHPPACLSGNHGPTPYPPAALGHEMSAAANEEDDMASTITVEPKRKYLGTAKPSILTQLRSSEGNNSQPDYSKLQGVWKTSNETKALSRNTFDALGRLRLESLKHSARPGPKSRTRGDIREQIGIPRTRGPTNRKNFKQLAVATSSSSVVKPIGDPQKNGIFFSAGKALAATPTTLGKGEQSSPITPTQAISGSGSSTRSQMATRIPARYREDLIEIGSPTSSKAEKKSNPKNGVEPKPRGGRGGWRGGPKKHVLEGEAGQGAPDPRKKQVRRQPSAVLTPNERSGKVGPTSDPRGAVSVVPDNKKNAVMAAENAQRKAPSIALNVKKRASKRGLIDDDPDR